jgi:RNA polymerase sigma-70 factor (ECF subfamily)
MVDPAKPVEAKRGADSEERVAESMDVRQLVLGHYQAVYRYAFRLAGRAEEAEDLAQQTFLVAQRKLPQLRFPEKSDRWLFAILRSCFFKSRRRKRPVPATNLEFDVDEVPEQDVRRLENQGIDEEQLQQALDAMPDEFRVVVVMFYFEEMSYKEMAAQLEIPLGTVMSRLSRAKQRLRQQLASRDSAETAVPRGGRPRPRPAPQRAVPG